MIGLCQEGKSSPDALGEERGVNSFFSALSACVGLSAAVCISNRTRLPFAGAAFCCPEDWVCVSLPVSKLIDESIQSLCPFAQSANSKTWQATRW